MQSEVNVPRFSKYWEDIWFIKTLLLYMKKNIMKTTQILNYFMTVRLPETTLRTHRRISLLLDERINILTTS